MAETSVDAEKTEENIHDARENNENDKVNDVREGKDTVGEGNLRQQDGKSPQSSLNAATEQQTHDRPCMSFCSKQTSKVVAKTPNTWKEDEQEELAVERLLKGGSNSSANTVSSRAEEDSKSKDNQIKKEHEENEKSDETKLTSTETSKVQQSQTATDLQSKLAQKIEQKGRTERCKQIDHSPSESPKAQNKEAKIVIPASEAKGASSNGTDGNAQITETEASSADNCITMSESTKETNEIKAGGDRTTLTKGLILGEEITNERNDESDNRQVDEADMCGKSPTFDRVDSKRVSIEKNNEKKQDDKTDLKGTPELTPDIVSGKDSAQRTFQTSLPARKAEQAKIVNVSPEGTCTKRTEIDKGGKLKCIGKGLVEDDTKRAPVAEGTCKESNSSSVASKEPEQAEIQKSKIGLQENGVGDPKACKQNKDTGKEDSPDFKLSNSKSDLKETVNADEAKKESKTKLITSKEGFDDSSSAKNGDKEGKEITTSPKEQRNIRTSKVKTSPSTSSRYGMRKRQQPTTVNVEKESPIKLTKPSKVQKAAPKVSADPEKFTDDTDSNEDRMSENSSDSEEDATSKSTSLRFDSDKETESDKESESEVKFTKRASNDSNFAVVYSFFTIFGGLLNLPECSLDEFEDSLDNCNDLTLQPGSVKKLDSVIALQLPDKHGLLEKLHLKLLRRLSRSSKTHFYTLGQVSNDRLIKYLIKFSKYVDLDLAWDMEKFGYHVLGSSERLLLLKALCEIHFDENPRFKVHYTDEYVKTDNIEAIRLQPAGFDMSGKAIWYQQDNAAGFRIYSVEEDDEDGSSWKLLASNLEEFEHLIAKLKKKSEVNPKDVALVKRKERKEKKKLAEAQVLKEKKGKVMAKKSRKRKADASESDSDEEDDNPCARCYSNKRPDLVLLCDLCDAAYHTLCLRPPLMTIPEGDWHCPYCKQLVLIDELTVRFKDITARKKTTERAAKRAVFDDIKLSNIVELGDDDPNSRRSGRRRTQIDYNFANYDQLIADAITTEGGKAASQPKTAISSGSFYGQSTSRKRHRRLNDLDDDSCESSLSDYEKSASEPELATVAIELENAITRGCRRSRRLKRKQGHEEQSESSSSDEENFVRRSTRRRISTQKTYMEYESDDTPEELITNSKRKKDDENDEYVASGSDEDAEEFLPVRSRRVIITDDDDDDDDIIDDDEIETDLEEDEALREEYEKDVVSDETEDEEEQPELTDEEEIDDADSTSEDDDYDDETDGGPAKVKKRKRRGEEGGVRRKGDKDMRTIIESMKEEKSRSSLKKTQLKVKPTLTAAESTPIREGVDTEEGKQIVHTDKFFEEANQTCQQGEGKKAEGTVREDEEITPMISNPEFEDSGKSGDCKKLDETKTSFGTVPKYDAQSKNDAQVANDLKKLRDARRMDKTKPTEEHGGVLTAIKKEESINASLGNTDAASILGRSETNKRRKTPSPLSGGAEDTEIVKRDQGKTVAPLGSENAGSYWRKDIPNLKSEISHVTDPLKNTMDLSSSRSQSMRYRYPQPVQHRPPEMHQQMHLDMRPHSKQSDLVRPQLYPTDFKRPFDPYAASNTPSPTYQPSGSQYPMRPPYQNIYEPRQFYSPNMQYYPMKAPPGYPGYQHSDGKSLWRPQEPTSMQWNYPQYSGMQPYGDTKVRSTVPSLHRPYLDVPNAMFSRESGAISSSAQPARPQKRSLPGSEKPRRTTDVPSHARRPTATESYAAFQSMVISPANESDRKKPKR